MAKQYFGKAALTIVRQKSNGSRAYVYAGQPVGDDVDAKELGRLESEGFIFAQEVATAAPVTPPVSGTGDVEKPDSSAKKAEWVEYAVAKGYDRTEAEKATQAELIKALS